MDDGEQEDLEDEALKRRKAARQRSLGSAWTVRTAAAQAAAAAAAAAAALGKRPRKASKKMLEQAETTALLASPLGKVRQGSGMAAKASMRRRGAAPAMEKMDGFEARRGSNPAYQPMALLPGEQPLGVELFFGEGRPLPSSRKLGPPTPGAHVAAVGGADLPPLPACLFICSLHTQ